MKKKIIFKRILDMANVFFSTTLSLCHVLECCIRSLCFSIILTARVEIISSGKNKLRVVQMFDCKASVYVTCMQSYCNFSTE